MLLLNLNKIRTAQERFEQVYTPEQFGLSADRIRDDYGFYIRHFGVHVDP